MLGEFTYCNPTRLHFGRESLSCLRQELARYGPTVQLIYGGGSIKRNGIYEQVTKVLRQCGKQVVDDGGITPNPTIQRVRQGAELARRVHTDLLLAVGGGSCCDYAKAVSISVHCEDDPWEKYYLRMEDVSCPIVPVGCVLTMAGTGSEMNGGAVITNPQTHQKLGHVFDSRVFPHFAVMNPEFTMTLPREQIASGCFDIMSHILEQYLSDWDDTTTDYIAEGLMRSLIHSSQIAVEDPADYQARSNIMWTATWALNTLLSCGKTTDWMAHMLGQTIGGFTNATHGMTLSAISLAYYRHIMGACPEKFARMAVNVWQIPREEKSLPQLAKAGVAAMEQWMRRLGVVMRVSQLDITEDMLDEIVSQVPIRTGGYRMLDAEEIRQILWESL